MNKKEKPVMLLGPSSTKGLEPVAEAAPLWELVQVWSFNLIFMLSKNIKVKLQRENDWIKM